MKNFKRIFLADMKKRGHVIDLRRHCYAPNPYNNKPFCSEEKAQLILNELYEWIRFYASNHPESFPHFANKPCNKRIAVERLRLIPLSAVIDMECRRLAAYYVPKKHTTDSKAKAA